MDKIANKNGSYYTTRFMPFVGSNTYAQHRYGCYIVYSYGEHYPMFIYKNHTWYENQDGYSRTTSKHKAQLRPNAETVKLTTEQMKEVVNGTFFVR